MLSKQTAYYSLVFVAAIGLFGPNELLFDSKARVLKAALKAEDRHLKSVDTHVPASEFDFEDDHLHCSEDQVPKTLSWDDIELSLLRAENEDGSSEEEDFPILQLNGMDVKVGYSITGSSVATTAKKFEISPVEHVPFMGLSKQYFKEEVIASGGANTPDFPANFMSFDFEVLGDDGDSLAGLQNLIMKIGKIDSTADSTSIVRVEMYDDLNGDIPLDVAITHMDQLLMDDYAWMNVARRSVKADAASASQAALFAKPSEDDFAVKRIRVDVGILTFDEGKVGSLGTQYVYPALDIKYCASSQEEEEKARGTCPEESAMPRPYTTCYVDEMDCSYTNECCPDGSNCVDTQKLTCRDGKWSNVITRSPYCPPSTQVAAPVVSAEEDVNTSDASSAGAVGARNGAPTVSGFGGENFSFVGRSGAWYSAVSALAFQWNVKLNKFEGCNSSSFTTGFGLTVFDGSGKAEHQVEVAVANPGSVMTGCGNFEDKSSDLGCLGAGSLELLIDGHKVVQSTELVLDETTRITAFNTIDECSRRWAEDHFNLNPSSSAPDATISAESSRALLMSSEEKVGLNSFGLFDASGSSAGEEQSHAEACQAWINERRANQDLLAQTGAASTVIIETSRVSFHIEYRQSHEGQCQGHNLDIWMYEVSPRVMKQGWKGMVGETKPRKAESPSSPATYPVAVTREEALKYSSDDDYEVISPYSTKCKACVTRKEQ